MSQRDQRDQRDSDGTLPGSHAPRLPQWPLRSAPTPPYRPLSPTPVVTASATGSSTDGSASLQGTPLRKLRDARRASTGMLPRTSLHPDGTPAPLPKLGPAGGGLIERGRARVVQRFTGSGVVPRTRLQRQEGHARRATVALAAVAAVLIAGSALLLFDPAIQRPGFGFSLGQIVHRRPSGAPLYVDGTQPPTTTPTASAQTPTPTPASGASTGVGTPVPTATPRPTVAPTPIPTVIPGGAVISFKPTTQPVSHSSFTGCAPPTACDFLTSSNSGSSPGSATINTTGSVSDEVAGPYNVTLTAVRYCYQPIPDIWKCLANGHSWDPAAWGNPTFNMQSSNFSCSGISIPAVGVNGTVPSSWCWWPTSWNPVPAGTFKGTLAQDEPPSCNSCDHFYIFSFAFSNAQWKSVRSHPVVTGADCNNAANAAYAKASTSATTTLNAWVAGRPRLAAQVNEIASARGCTPGVNAASGTTTGSSAASWSATVLDPNTAVAGAASYIKNHVPQGYSLTGGPTTCSAQSLLSSSNYSYDSGTGVVTITCPSSGTATYDWASATQGKSAQDSLKSALAGKSLAAALDLCNGRVAPYATGYPGIQQGTCTITLSGGNVSVVPDASKLQIIPQ